jgi:hypothetical protein
MNMYMSTYMDEHAVRLVLPQQGSYPSRRQPVKELPCYCINRLSTALLCKIAAW